MAVGQCPSVARPVVAVAMAVAVVVVVAVVRGEALALLPVTRVRTFLHFVRLGRLNVGGRTYIRITPIRRRKGEP